MSFSDHNLSVFRRPSRCCCCRCSKLFTFSASSPEPLSQFNLNLVQSILRWWGFKFVQMKDHTLFEGEVITQKQKYIEKKLKIFFSRTTGPMSSTLGTKHLFLMRIQICSNEVPCPFPRGDNNKKAKYIDEIYKSSPPELLGRFQSNLA